MLAKLAQFFKEPPVKETIQDGEKVKSMYAHWRLRIFYACFIGYTVFYLCKKNIAVALHCRKKLIVAYVRLTVSII